MFFPLKDENPAETFPYITVLLIAVNCFMFFITLAMGRNSYYLVAGYGVVPFEITHAVDIEPKVLFGPYITLITSLFLHGSFWHLLGNMWFLWIFGNNIEDIEGHFRFIIFYFLGGIAASFLQIAVNPSSTIPTIGASGAVSAILGAYMLKFPRARVKTLLFIFIFITIINVPAIAFIGIWFFIQLISSVGRAGEGVAWFAHIGGFIFGLLTIKLFEKKRRGRKYKVYK
ncbi:MAG: rhomboid family intramembrane serine protease [Spirochaetota bacterium]|nr:MAG: rhomboid family intramembrane serine protease [Spirochaetota bacterium]